MSELLVYLLLAILALVAIIIHAFNIVVILHWQGLLMVIGSVFVACGIVLTVLYVAGRVRRAK